MELAKQTPQMMKVKEIYIDMESGRTYFLEDALAPSKSEEKCASAHIGYINFADLCEEEFDF